MKANFLRFVYAWVEIDLRERGGWKQPPLFIYLKFMSGVY